MRHAAFILLFAATTGIAAAEIRYTVKPISGNKLLQVTMSFSSPAGKVELQMPNWAPGYYTLNNYGSLVRNFKWIDSKGKPLKVMHSAVNSWKVTLPNSGLTKVVYTVPSEISAGAISYGGPSTYMYVVGRKYEACRLDLSVPKGWKIAVGLDYNGQSATSFKAPGYDVLADNPVSIGNLRILTYVSHGKPGILALRGEQKDKIDAAKFLKVCQTVSDIEGKFFGGLPFNKYVWHFGVFDGEDGAGGLEHLSSTEIGIARGLGPHAARVCAHEFFHLWNVKRIRSQPLGPFDYTKLPKTGALYWLEGVTDYYASLLMLRSKYLDEPAFLGDLTTNLSQIRSNPAHLKVSPYDSSYRVDETDGGKGNSDGYEISYYNLGWVVGLCLDLDLRSRTSNKRSLDDVERALWSKYQQNGKGFAEDEIEKQYVKFGGSKAFFQQVVMQPGELPVESVLSKVGLNVETTEKSLSDKGFDLNVSPDSFAMLAINLKPFAKEAGLTEKDAILEVNGKTVVGKDLGTSFRMFDKALSEVQPGDELKLKVKRAAQTLDITYKAAELKIPVLKVVELENATPQQLALRKAWYEGKTN